MCRRDDDDDADDEAASLQATLLGLLPPLVAGGGSHTRSVSMGTDRWIHTQCEWETEGRSDTGGRVRKSER